MSTPKNNNDNEAEQSWSSNDLLNNTTIETDSNITLTTTLVETNDKEQNDTIIRVDNQINKNTPSCPGLHDAENLIKRLCEENEKLKLWATEQINSLSTEVSSLKHHIKHLETKVAMRNSREHKDVPRVYKDKTTVAMSKDTANLLSNLGHLQTQQRQQFRHNTQAAAEENKKARKRNTQEKPHSHQEKITKDGNYVPTKISKEAESRQNKTRNGTEGTKIRKTITKPDAMKTAELGFEMNERRKRRNNIVITGDVSGWKNKNSVQQWLKVEFGVEAGVRNVQQVNGAIIATLATIDLKKVIMAQKNKLRGTNLWIDDDYTRREAHVQAWIRHQAAEEKRFGYEAQVKYMKLKADGQLWKWDELKGDMFKQTFHGKRQQRK